MAPAEEHRLAGPPAPATRVAFQFVGSLKSSPGDRPEELFAQVVETAVASFEARFPRPLPPEARTGRACEAELPGLSMRSVAIPEDGIWTARLMHADTPEAGRPAVAGRTWITEIALVPADDGVRVGIRLLCASAPHATEEPAPATPTLLLDLAARYDLRETRRVDGLPWRLVTTDDLEEFHAFLVNPRRILPVYLLTQPSQSRLGLQTLEYLLDADELARRTLGLAYVATMPTALGFHWTARVGKPWSAYLGTVRTYRPGLRFDEDLPFDHPLSVAERILAFQYRGLNAEDAFLEMLVDQARSHAATMRVHWGRLIFLDDARIRRAELLRDSATDDSALVEGLKEQVEALAQKIEGLKNELDVAVEMAGQVEEAKLAAEDEALRLRTQLDALRREFMRKTGTSPDAIIRAPRSFQELEEWARVQLAGRLVLHPRAVRALRDAVYEDPPLVARALLLLANEFRTMQLGEPDAHEAFEAARQQLNLRFGRSITEERAGEEGDTYYVRLGPRGRERRFLEYHLRKGSGKDPRHCLAIYFLWDETREQVLVGWLPGHLDNRMT